MPIQEKIRTLREINHLTQEQMAEELEISKNSYAKIEQGKTKLNIERLQQIAHIFNINVADLIGSNERGLVFVIGGVGNDCNQSTNYYETNKPLLAENEKLQLIIDHQKQLLAEKDKEIARIIEAKEREIELLKNLVEVLQGQKS
ncbi:MAG: helix-turn-helix transcriptional regulator [Moraxellaceae bacterium]|nr:helix-turn-helix transcriptional regulator [Moraxellaceae bacterium]